MKVNKKIIKLFTNRGFYILLALAAVLAGVSGYVKNLRSKTAVDTPISAVISEPTPLQSSDQKFHIPRHSAQTIQTTGRAQCRLPPPFHHPRKTGRYNLSFRFKASLA